MYGSVGPSGCGVAQDSRAAVDGLDLEHFAASAGRGRIADMEAHRHPAASEGAAGAKPGWPCRACGVNSTPWRRCCASTATATTAPPRATSRACAPNAAGCWPTRASAWRTAPSAPEKPTCANCQIHCYGPRQRETVRIMMRHAGPRMLLRHPVLALCPPAGRQPTAGTTQAARRAGRRTRRHTRRAARPGRAEAPAADFLICFKSSSNRDCGRYR